MLLRIYEALWVVIALVGVILLATGNLGPREVVLLGMACVGMIFMGMISVLPFTASHTPGGKH